jgi:hypothetical protein
VVRVQADADLHLAERPLEITCFHPCYSYYDVSAGLYYAGNSRQLVGQSITYTITDATTGQTVGTFSGTSNEYATCTVVVSVNAQDTVQTLTGKLWLRTPAASSLRSVCRRPMPPS